MASVDSLDDDRDTSLPTSALSPQEYRTFRTFVNDMDRTGIDNQVALHSVLEFLSTFKGVSQIVAQQIVDVVLGPQQSQLVGEGYVYAMIRLIGHWQTDARIQKSLIFVQARVPERTGSARSSYEFISAPNPPPTPMTLNPFRASSTILSPAPKAQPPDVGRGVEAFKRLMLNSKKELHNSDYSHESERTFTSTPQKYEDGASLQFGQTEYSNTSIAFVYSSDEDEETVSSVKHSPENNPLVEVIDKRNPPPLTIPNVSPQKPAPPPSRRRGASGSNQNTNQNAHVHAEEKAKVEEKSKMKRELPPAPPAPRRTLSSASTSHYLERSSSLRKDAPPQPIDSSRPQASDPKPRPPRPRRRPSDTSVASVDTAIRAPPEPDPTSQPGPSAKRLSTQAPPPPPPPRRKPQPNDPPTPTSRRSTELPTRLSTERSESPRRSSAPDEKPRMELQDSELSLELLRLQREVDELVHGLTKKRGKS